MIKCLRKLVRRKKYRDPINFLTINRNKLESTNRKRNYRINYEVYIPVRDVYNKFCKIYYRVTIVKDIFLCCIENTFVITNRSLYYNFQRIIYDIRYFPYWFSVRSIKKKKRSRNDKRFIIINKIINLKD